MDKTVETMIANLKEKTGHTLEEWREIISNQNLVKHGEIVNFLKDTHQVTHGYASEIALKVLSSDADSASNADDFIVSQYKGKEHLKAFYDKLLEEIHQFGGDFKIQTT